MKSSRRVALSPPSDYVAMGCTYCVSLSLPLSTNTLMFKKLLPVVALVATQLPAVASPYSTLRNVNLTRVVERAGITVKFYDPMCDERGSYGGFAPNQKMMVICVDNHVANGEMDYAELGDTLRHEAIHVAQTCHGKGEPKPILGWNQIAKYSNDRILSIVQRYAPEDQHLEYEAFTGAAVLSNNQVADIVKQTCQL